MTLLVSKEQRQAYLKTRESSMAVWEPVCSHGQHWRMGGHCLYVSRMMEGNPPR